MSDNRRNNSDATRSIMGKSAIIQDARSSAYQRTANDLIAEARQLQDLTAPAASARNTPHALLTTPEEIAFFRQTKRGELETLVKNNFRQLNNWLKYAEWEESQKDFVRARSVYERAIPSSGGSHGSKPELWRQYAEMEMRCPAPSRNNDDDVNHTDASLQKLTTTAASSEVLGLLGVSSFSQRPHQSVGSTALMVLPTTTVASVTASNTKQVELATAIAAGGPQAAIARVRSVFERALNSLPQCDDLYMKYILYEATLAHSQEDDEPIRGIYRRWLHNVDFMAHVYELFAEFECSLAHYSNVEAKRERVEGLLKELVAKHSSVRTWLVYSNAMEKEFDDLPAALAVLRAALVALGPFGKYGHDGALLQQIGRLYGQLGLWSAEGRIFLQKAFTEAKAIEQSQLEKAKRDGNGSAQVSNKVSEALFLAYTALEKQFGGHDHSALEQLNLMSQRLQYYTLLERQAGGTSGEAKGIDATDLTLSLRLVGCLKDEERLHRIASVDKRIVANNDVGSSASGSVPSYTIKAALSAEAKSPAEGTAAEGSIWAITSLLTDEKKKAQVISSSSAEGSSAGAFASTPTASLELTVSALEAFHKANNSGLTHLCDNAKASYVNLVLEVVSVQLGAAEAIAKSLKPDNLPSIRQQVSNQLGYPIRLVQQALGLLPSFSPHLFEAAIALKWSDITVGSMSCLPTDGRDSIRVIFGSAIHNLRADPQALSDMFKHYIAFEQLASTWMPHLDSISKPVGTPNEVSANAIRKLYMEALKMKSNPCPVEWWVAFADFERTEMQEERCFQILAKAETQLTNQQAALGQEIAATASSGATTTATQRQQWAVAASKIQAGLDTLLGNRLGLLIKCGRHAAASELYASAIKAALAEYCVQAVITAEGPDSSHGAAVPISKPDALAALPCYRKLKSLLSALPAFAPQMAAAVPQQLTDGTDPKSKSRGDDTASAAYVFASGLYRSLTSELRHAVAAKMAFSNDSLALSIMEPFLALWRSYEAQYGTTETLAAVSADAKSAPAAGAGPAAGDGKAKKRRRLADLAENY